MTDGQPSVEELFHLESIGDDHFVGPPPSRVAHAQVDGHDTATDAQVQRAFGGQVAGQALAAAYATVDSRPIHSLHSYFLAGADPTTPMDFAVHRSRDGRNFSNRSVEASQRGRTIFSMMASFRVDAPGVEHQEQAPEASHPEDLEPASGAEAFEWSSVEIRFAKRWSTSADGGHVASRLLWFRLRDRMTTDDPAVHACALAYASDLTLIRTALGPHQAVISERGVTLASLDHSIWFHRPARADEWLLYSSVSPSASRSLALAIGHVYTVDGMLVATVVQEGSVVVGGP